MSAAWMAVIFALSSLPGSAVPGRFSSLGHFTAYAVLGALLAAGLGVRDRRTLVLAVLVASAYGVTDEFHQSFVPGRNPDVVDWVVDTLGATVAVLSLAAMARAQTRRDSR